MRKILIIEDDELIAQLERDYLEINGFEIEIAMNGDKGLELALNKEFDLILLDLMLPSKDGFQICREIRKSKEIPIIMVTAKKESIDKIRGLGLGADDYIVKPFDPSELVARVNAHLKRYDRLTTVEKKDDSELGVINFGRVKILTQAWRVYVGDVATVTVHINRIREKIEEDSSNPKFIETVWGAGYRFKI